jgi:hypothetical protein
MRKLFFIFLIFFAELSFFGASPAPRNISHSSDAVFKSTGIMCPTDVVQGDKNSDQSPCTKSKKRIRGLSYEFLASFARSNLRIVISESSVILPGQSCVAFYHCFCNGKRGPPLCV